MIQFKKIILFFILICFTITLLYSQKIPSTIRGNISDENNELVPFVNIWIKNNKINIGTSSDVQGNFNLNLRGINVADTITFSCIGYNSFYLPISKIENSNNLKIILPQKTENLNEFVVTGKKTSVYDVIKNYNKNREKYMPKANVEYEIFARQFVKNSNDKKYIVLIESYFKILSDNKNVIDSDIFYGNRITNQNKNKSCYDLYYFPVNVDLNTHWEYPKITKSIYYNYKIDSIIPDNNGFVYVVSEIYKDSDISLKNYKINNNGSIDYKGINEEEYKNKKDSFYDIIKYYITNEYKLIKYVFERVYYPNWDTKKNKNYSSRPLLFLFEINYEEFNELIFPVRMNGIRTDQYYNEKNEFCLIKTHFTEYYMKKIQEVGNLSNYDKNNKLLDFYTMSIMGKEENYKEQIIYDSIRKLVIDDLKNK